MNARARGKDWKSRRSTDDGVWLVSLMSDDFGFIGFEQETLPSLDNPCGPSLSPMSPDWTKWELARRERRNRELRLRYSPPWPSFDLVAPVIAFDGEF
ncbi:MAG: hypothetical protein FJX45_08870 [Alphaproteobacteria bacterium]|nr:hypothetical protein [Alphaproteobacteria bacterium]